MGAVCNDPLPDNHERTWLSTASCDEKLGTFLTYARYALTKKP